MVVEPRPSIDDAVIQGFAAGLRGALIQPGDPTYDTARKVYNGMIDRRPALIVQCANAGDVVAAVTFAREQDLLVAIRGGGHNGPGLGVCDDGLVIDLSAMKEIQVDPTGRTARAQGGVTWGELDRETQRFGLATPGGEVSTTGIAGFTLGGGMGLLMRQHGLACDNLRSIEIVTADGAVRTASADEHPDLFWASRGGGRGLGVVTWFEFELHPVGPEVAASLLFYPYEDAGRILRAWTDVALGMPESVTPQIILWSVPPDPAIPAELHGQKVVVVQAVYAGPVRDGGAVLAPLDQLGTPLLDLSGAVPYVDIQSSVDSLFPTGGRYYMKSHFMNRLTDDVISTLLTWDSRRPTPDTLIAIRTLGGAVSRVGVEESAYPHRSAAFNVSIDAGWTDPTLDETAIGWARGAWNALSPFADGGVYINFSGLDDEADAVRSAVFGESRDRLVEVRSKYDPTGLFEAAARRP